MTLLHLACQEGLYQTARYILKKRPSLVDAPTAAGWTPVMMACESGYVELIDLLVTKGGEVILKYTCENGSPLHAAITGRKPLEAIETLFTIYDDSFDLEIAQMANKCDESGTHPLYLAVHVGNAEVVELLLEGGADPSAATRDSDLTTVLHVAAELGRTEIATLILQSHPELLSKVDKVERNTPLHVACVHNRLDVLQVFCDEIDMQAMAAESE